MIEQMGIYPDRTIREKRPTLKAILNVVIAMVRMRNKKQAWEVNKEMNVQLTMALERQRKKGVERVRGIVL